MELRLPHYQSIVAMISALAGRRDTDYEISKHAEQEMIDDEIDLLDIRSALMNIVKATEQNRDGLYYIFCAR